MAPAQPSTIDASPVQNILFVARLGPRATGFKFESTSLPGHLIQLVKTGRVHQECNGRGYELAPGRVIWYHEDEFVRGRVLAGPWSFYSVNFIAPTLPPPDFETRLLANRGHLEPHFQELLEVWEDKKLPALARKLRAHAALAQILANLSERSQEPAQIDPRARLWWELELELRKDLRRSVTLSTLARLAKCSPDNLSRACHLAVGTSPMKRVKQVRLSLARGLVQRSKLSMSEIADRIGYQRVHEFSRDYRKHFGLPASVDRNRGPT
jgi:AraC-like DNA-binding protein